MKDNEPVTALSGAATSSEVEDDTVPAQPEPDETAESAPEDFRGVNQGLRYEYLQCNLQIQVAREAGDKVAERRARSAREAVAARFVAKNARLAQSTAAPLMIKDRDLAQEHLQAALLGLWEAFVGTDPETADGVIVGEDGKLHPTGGWDPAKGTFATWAGHHIAGRARRSVRTSEGAFTGMSYHTWGQKPKVDTARAELIKELGYQPSVEEVAERAGVTPDTVRAVSKATPASLDAQVSSEGGTTLGDLVVDEGNIDDERVLAGMVEAEFISRAAQMGTVDLMVLLLRNGLVGSPARSVVQTADKLGLGRGSIGPAMVRAHRLLPHIAMDDEVDSDTTAAQLAVATSS